MTFFCRVDKCTEWVLMINSQRLRIFALSYPEKVKKNRLFQKSDFSSEILTVFEKNQN